jgi:hypothetical protein
MSTARRIEEFVPAKSDVSERPKYIGHLMEMPLTNGEEALIDPEGVESLSPHRQEQNVTVLRQKDDKFTYFINRPYATVKRWIAEALADD